jgi:hypothetical protein
MAASMDALQEISRNYFHLLVERDVRAVDNEIERGAVIYWNQPSEALRAANPGKRWPRKFIAFDAALVILADVLEERGIKRGVVTTVLPAAQLVLPSGIDRQNTRIMIAFGRDKATIAVACGTEDELHAQGLFVGKKFSGSWRLSVSEAMDVLKERAAKHKIKLPKTFAPPANAPPLRIQGMPPAWKFPLEGGRTTEWKPTYWAVEMLALPETQ